MGYVLLLRRNILRNNLLEKYDFKKHETSTVRLFNLLLILDSKLFQIENTLSLTTEAGLIVCRARNNKSKFFVPLSIASIMKIQFSESLDLLVLQDFARGFSKVDKL